MSHVDDGVMAAYLDGEVTAADAVRIDPHLAECTECQRRLSRMRENRQRAGAILRTAGPVPRVAPAFAEIAARSHALRNQARRSVDAGQARGAQMVRIRQMRSLAWAASIVLAVALGWYGRQWSLSRTPSAGDPRRLVDQESASLPGGTALATRDESPQVRQDSGPAVVERATDLTAPQPEPDRLRAAPSARDAAPDTPSRNLAIAPRQEAAAPQEQPAAPREEPPAPAAARQRAEAFTPPPDTPLQAETRSPQPQQNDAADRAARAATPAPSMAGAAAPPPNEWTLVDYTLAAAMLRQPPLRVPGLDVTGYAIRSARGGSVRVTQRLPGGQALQLIELPAGSDLDARLSDEASRLPADGLTSVTIERAGVGITGRAALPVDSLRVLLQQIQ